MPEPKEINVEKQFFSASIPLHHLNVFAKERTG